MLPKPCSRRLNYPAIQRYDLGQGLMKFRRNVAPSFARVQGSQFLSSSQRHSVTSQKTECANTKYITETPTKRVKERARHAGGKVSCINLKASLNTVRCDARQLGQWIPLRRNTVSPFRNICMHFQIDTSAQLSRRSSCCNTRHRNISSMQFTQTCSFSSCRPYTA